MKVLDVDSESVLDEAADKTFDEAPGDTLLLKFPDVLAKSVPGIEDREFIFLPPIEVLLVGTGGPRSHISGQDDVGVGHSLERCFRHGSVCQLGQLTLYSFEFREAVFPAVTLALHVGVLGESFLKELIHLP